MCVFEWPTGRLACNAIDSCSWPADCRLCAEAETPLLVVRLSREEFVKSLMFANSAEEHEEEEAELALPASGGKRLPSQISQRAPPFPAGGKSFPFPAGATTKMLSNVKSNLIRARGKSGKGVASDASDKRKHDELRRKLVLQAECETQKGVEAQQAAHTAAVAISEAQQAEIRSLAIRRGEMLDPKRIRSIAGMPGGFTDAQIELLSAKAVTLVCRPGELLALDVISSSVGDASAPDVPGGDLEPMEGSEGAEVPTSRLFLPAGGDRTQLATVNSFNRDGRQNGVHIIEMETNTSTRIQDSMVPSTVPSPPPSPPGKVHPQPLSKPTAEFVFIVLKGSLSAVDTKGQAVQASGSRPRVHTSQCSRSSPPRSAVLWSHAHS